MGELLADLGYRVTLQRFRFHPSAMLGFPVAGAGLLLAALLVAPLLLLPGVPAWGALAVWIAGASATLLLAYGIGVGRLPLGEAREDVNLLAVQARSGEVDGSGSADVAVHVTERLVVSMSGSGDVRYAGSPTVEASTSGSASVRGI